MRHRRLLRGAFLMLVPLWGLAVLMGPLMSLMIWCSWARLTGSGNGRVGFWLARVDRKGCHGGWIATLSSGGLLRIGTIFALLLFVI